MSEPRLKATDPDAPLVRQAQAGDFAAFETLVGRYEKQVYGVARRIVRASHDAEEAVQDTFLSALEHLRDFRAEATFRSWLLRIATNAALRILRKRRGHVPLTSAMESDQTTPHPEFIAPWQDDPAVLAGRRETQQLLDTAMQALDEKYRLVFLLRDVEELSIEEAAEALQISPANVKVRLMRARLMLRERLTRALGDPLRAAPPHRHDA